MAESALTVLVIAVGGNVSHGILKALNLSGLPCRVVGADINPLKVGLYTVDRAYIAPWANEPNFLNWLVDTCRAEGVQAILSGAELVLRVLAQHEEYIREKTGAVCLVNPPELYALGDDKLMTCRWLEAQGLNFPAYAPAEERKAVDVLLREHGFPLIAKPRQGGGSRGVMLVENRDDLDYICRKPQYLLQEYLSGSEYTVGCFCDRDGNVRGTIAMEREIQEGTTVRAVVGDYPAVSAEAERIATALKPRGPCNFQLKVHEDRAVCFEVNMRFSGTSPLRARLGFNEVDAALRHYVLGEEQVDLPQVREGVILRYWNELYVSPDAYAKLREEARLDDPHAYPCRVEDYGMQQ